MSEPIQLTRDAIRNYVGLSSFQKGETYFLNGAIQKGKIKGRVISALCQGHEFDPYKVSAILGDSGIKQSFCACPVGSGGKCKHVCALLLTWLENPEAFAEWQKLKDSLDHYDKTALLEFLDLVEEHVEGFANLVHAFDQNLETFQSPNLAKYFRRIEEAFNLARVPWYHDEEGSAEIAFALGRIRSDVGHLLQQGHVSEAIQVYRAIIQSILNYLEEKRDPWGNLHAEIKSCIQEMEKGLSGVKDLDTRQKILKALFSIIEEQSYREDDIGADTAKEVIVEHATSAEKSKIASWVRPLMKQEAKDKEEDSAPTWMEDFLIDLEKDQLPPEVYLDHYRKTGQIIKLVNSLLDLGRVKEAERVAQQKESRHYILALADSFVKHRQEEITEHLVAKTVQKESDVRLHQWLKDFYKKRDEPEKALEQALHLLYLVPQFSHYQAVQELAEITGKWKELHPKVLQKIGKLDNKLLLVEIYLDEKELGRAIEIFNSFSAFSPEGLAQSTNRELLAFRLAIAARHKYPHFTIKVYEEAVERLIDERNREGYQRACHYLKEIRDIYQEIGQSKAWDSYLKSILQTYNRFRALKEEMQRARLIPLQF
jgi:hypothetical protein